MTVPRDRREPVAERGSADEGLISRFWKEPASPVPAPGPGDSPLADTAGGDVEEG
jgi:hypothetical protein